MNQRYIRMGRKYFHFITIVLLGLFLLSNCSKKKKVGFLMDTDNIGRWIRDRELFTQNIQDRGWDIIIYTANNNPTTQLEQAKLALDDNVDILVVVPVDMNLASQIVNLAHEYDVPVISYDRMIRNCYLDFYISFDNIQIGELQAESIVSECPNGKYAIIGGAVSDNNSFLFRLGQLSVLLPLIEKDDIEVIFDEYANQWTPQEGYRLMKKCLDNNGIPNAVIAANDKIADGVIRALMEYDVDTLPCISGQDADALGYKHIIEGTQTMSVYKSIEEITTRTADICSQIMSGGQQPEAEQFINNGKVKVPSVLLQSKVVNIDNIRETVPEEHFTATYTNR